MADPVRVDWNRSPVSIHHNSIEALQSLLLHLLEQHGITKHSIAMPDREEGGFVAFLYQVCDPAWIVEWQQQMEE